MRYPILPAALALILFTGCTTTPKSHESSDHPMAGPNAKTDDEGQDAQRKLHELEQKLELSRTRLEIAERQLDAAHTSSENRLARMQSEMELAERGLKKLVEADAPAQIASAELDLRSTRDRAQEAAEELAQIELMYADQDLNDKTAEFVVGRGRRSAERAAARIAIQEARFNTLKEVELPMERERAEIGLRSKSNELEEARREIEISLMNKEVAVTEARQALERAEHELHEAREEQE